MSTTESTTPSTESTTPNAPDAPAQDPALNQDAVSGTPDKLDSEVWDENGMARRGKNVYLNDMAPTTTFHPYELPAHPIARRMVPQHLISEENGFSESPSGDVAPDVRAEKGRLAQEKADEEFASLLQDTEATHRELGPESTAGTQGGETALHAQETNRPEEY